MIRSVIFPQGGNKMKSEVTEELEQFILENRIESNQIISIDYVVGNAYGSNNHYILLVYNG